MFIYPPKLNSHGNSIGEGRGLWKIGRESATLVDMMNPETDS